MQASGLRSSVLNPRHRVCFLCRQWVRERGYPEHNDWHMAMDLQRRENKHAGLLTGSGSRSGKGQGGSQATLPAMLKRHKST
jgi:hypothetical protein